MDNKAIIGDSVDSRIVLPSSSMEGLAIAGIYRIRAFAYDMLTKVIGEELWDETAIAHNLVVEQGRNDMLDQYLAGSGYTAAWYMSLIDSVGYTGIVAGDTAASHAGWAEYVAYTEASRPAVAWSAAAAGAKATSADVVFTIPSSITLKGAFLSSSATKSGTAGKIFSAGLFATGDKVISGSAILNVAYSAQLTAV